MRPEFRHGDPSRPHRGWFSRGYLPHFDRPDLVQSLTMRLGDSIPADLRQQLHRESDKVIRSKRLESLLDQGLGACELRRPEIAGMVEASLLHFDGIRYRMLAWVLMPNHLHCVFECVNGYPLCRLVHSWKSFTAHEAGRLGCGASPFWWPDYYDRFVRDFRHLEAVIAYIHRNPVSAGLCQEPEEWPWSSAYGGRRSLTKIVLPDGTFLQPPAWPSDRDLTAGGAGTESTTGTAGVSPAPDDRANSGDAPTDDAGPMGQAGRLRSQCGGQYEIPTTTPIHAS